MNKALIVEGDEVTIIDFVSWDNYYNLYFKLITLEGETILCSCSNVKLLFNIDREKTNQEIVSYIFQRDMKIKCYDNGNKLVK